MPALLIHYRIIFELSLNFYFNITTQGNKHLIGKNELTRVNKHLIRKIVLKKVKEGCEKSG